ncbi:MAG TPA: hypothetical protein VF092_08115 [Longimicrobium sp.]
MADNTRGGRAGDKMHGGEHRGGSRPQYSPNAIVKNPTSQQYEADKTHRRRQKTGG